MPAHYCKNHPDISAKFRCFHCREHICSDCRTHLAHHYFCGYRCFFRFTIKEILKKSKPYTIPALAVSQLILLLMMLLIFVYFHKRLDNGRATRQETGKQDSVLLGEIRNYLNSSDFQLPPAQQGPATSTDQYSFHVSMESGKDWVTAVWRNDTPVQTEVASQEGRMSLTVPLEYGNNQLKILSLDVNQKPVFKKQLQVHYYNPKVELFRHSIERGRTDSKNLAITFDGGSDDTYSHEILRILKNQNIKSTFFLTGRFIEKHPDLVREMVSDGHEIGNHTYNHPHLTSYSENLQHYLAAGITRDFLHRQLLMTDSIFYRVTGIHMVPYWRAPFGEYNNEILTWAAEAGFLHIHWTGHFDTHDWVTDENSELYKTPSEIYDSIMQAEKHTPNGLNGVIMLMHLDSNREEGHAFEILPRLIETMRIKGYGIGNVTELLN